MNRPVEFEIPFKSAVPLYSSRDLELDRLIVKAVYSARLPVSRNYVIRMCKAVSRDEVQRVAERLIVLNQSGIVDHRIQPEDDYDEDSPSVSVFWKPGNPLAEAVERKTPPIPYSDIPLDSFQERPKKEPEETPEDSPATYAGVVGSERKESTSEAVPAPVPAVDNNKCTVPDAMIYALVNEDRVFTYPEIVILVAGYQKVCVSANYRRSLYQRLRKLVRDGYLSAEVWPAPYDTVYYGPALKSIDKARSDALGETPVPPAESPITDTTAVADSLHPTAESVVSTAGKLKDNALSENPVDCIDLGRYLISVRNGEVVVLNAESNSPVSELEWEKTKKNIDILFAIFK